MGEGHLLTVLIVITFNTLRYHFRSVRSNTCSVLSRFIKWMKLCFVDLILQNYFLLIYFYSAEIIYVFKLFHILFLIYIKIFLEVPFFTLN